MKTSWGKQEVKFLYDFYSPAYARWMPFDREQALIGEYGDE